MEEMSCSSSSSSRKRLKKEEKESNSESQLDSLFVPQFLLESVVQDAKEKISVFQLEITENEGEKFASFRLLASNFSFFSSLEHKWKISLKDLQDISLDDMQRISSESAPNFSSPSMEFLCRLFSFKNGRGETNFLWKEEKISVRFKGIPFQDQFFITVHFQSSSMVDSSLISSVPSFSPYSNAMVPSPLHDDQGGERMIDGSSNGFVAEEVIKKKKLGHNMTLRTFFDSAPLWMAAAEIVDDHTLLYHHINATFARVLLKERAGEDPVNQCVGKTSRELGLQDVQIQFWVDNMRKAKGKNHFTFEIVDPLLGETFSCLCKHLKEEYYLCITNDITENRRLENELRKAKLDLETTVKERTKALEEALAVKSRFLATMSHEIRTPLAGIVGGLSFLSKMDLSAEGKEMVRIGNVCSEQLLMVINDVLDLSKIEANQLTLDKRPLRFKTILEESIEITSFEANKKNLPIILRSSLPPNLVVEVDKGRVRQIVLNLLSNSVKFTQEGEIVIIAKILEQKPVNTNNNNENGRRSSEGDNREVVELEISVKDTGIGISDVFKDRIFSPFSQSDSSITRKYGGSGLGLSICKRLVEMMGGKMWFESEENKGTNFFFTLRVTKADKGNPEEEEQQYILQKIREEIASMNIRSRTVIVVENNETQMRDLVYRLTELNFKTFSYPSCQDLLKDPNFQEGNNTVDMVLLDSQDNQNDIKSVIETLKKRGCTSRKMVFTTKMPTNEGDESQLKELEEGMLTLIKPIRSQQLLLLLDRVFLQLKYGSFSEIIVRNQTVKTNFDNLRVLVCEDNIMNQKIIQRYLKAFGIDAKIAENGQKCLDILQNESFDVILMDVMMPVMGGIEATRIIRETLPKHLQPKIFALTADVFKENRESCLEAGMDDVLTKPIDQKTLREAFSRI